MPIKSYPTLYFITTEDTEKHRGKNFLRSGYDQLFLSFSLCLSVSSVAKNLYRLTQRSAV